MIGGIIIIVLGIVMFFLGQVYYVEINEKLFPLSEEVEHTENAIVDETEVDAAFFGTSQGLEEHSQPMDQDKLPISADLIYEVTEPSIIPSTSISLPAKEAEMIKAIPVENDEISELLDPNQQTIVPQPEISEEEMYQQLDVYQNEGSFNINFETPSDDDILNQMSIQTTSVKDDESKIFDVEILKVGEFINPLDTIINTDKSEEE